MSVRRMCRTAMITALLCVLGPMTVPMGPVPLSMTTLAVYLAGAMLGAKGGALAVALYLAIGAVGMPVFAGFTAGIHRMAGTTGGYLLGYVFCAGTVGWAAERRLPLIPAMIAGTLICYGLGTAWFMAQTGADVVSALSGCVLPFLPGDALKIAAASSAARITKNGLASV